jgi:HK97 family phage major capsid protein
MSQIQQDYNETLTKIDALKKDNGGDVSKFSEEAMKAYTGLLDNADSLYQKVVAEDREAKIRELKGQSAGCYVAGTFLGNEIPGRGEFPGVTADPRSGELYALDGEYKSVAEAKINQLKSGEYKDSFANYIRTVGLGGKLDVRTQIALNNGSEKVMETKGANMKILAEGTDTGGAYWLPPDFRPDLIKKSTVMATVRPDAKVYTTGTDHITFPAVVYNGSTVDDTYAQFFAAGTRLSWRNSAGSTSDFSEAINPIAGQVNIPVQLATCAIVLMREQVEDNSFDILGYISEIGGEAFALGEEYAYTLGSGAGQPQGFANHPSFGISYSTYTAVGGSTFWGGKVSMASTTVVWGSASVMGSTTATTGLFGMEAILPPQYEANAKWYASKFTYSAIKGINSGTATLPQWGFGTTWPNYSEKLDQQPLLGYQIRKNMFVPSVTNATTFVYLGDMQGYYIVDRVGISVEVFREVYGLRDQVVVYMRKRTGGQLVDYWRMKCGTST